MNFKSIIKSKSYPISFWIIVWLIFYLPIAFKGSFIDEQDNWVGGYLISQGRVVYADFFSHHGPLAYFFAVIPALINHQAYWLYRLPTFIFQAGSLFLLLTKTSHTWHKYITFLWILMAILSPSLNTQMLLGESIVSLMVLFFLITLVNPQSKNPTLVYAYLVISWIIIWSVPTYLPLTLLLGLVLWLLMIPHKKSLNRTTLKYAGFIGLILFSLLPGYLFFHQVFSQFQWSVFTFNTQYYLTNRLTSDSNQSLSTYLFQRPFNLYLQEINTTITLHLNLIRTLISSVFLGFNTHLFSSFKSGVSVSFNWWWERYRSLNATTTTLFLISILGFLRSNSPKKIITLGLLSVYILFSRLRDTETFHLSSYYLSVIGLGLYTLKSNLKQQRFISILIAFVFLGLILEHFPKYWQFAHQKSNFISSAILNQSHLIQSTYSDQNRKLLNLTSVMTYFLTTPYVPASPLTFYNPWINSAPQLNTLVWQTLTNPDHLIVYMDQNLKTFAPEIADYIQNHFHTSTTSVYFP